MMVQQDPGRVPRNHEMNKVSPELLCRAPRNRTLTLTEPERLEFRPKLTKLPGPTRLAQIRNRTINQNLTEVLSRLPEQFADLLFLDPPYNLTKAYNGNMFAERAAGEYRAWFESWFVPLLRTLKSNASVYVCADWRSSGIVQSVLEAAAQGTQPHNLGAREGQGGADELEELHRGHLVLHGLGRLLLRRGRSQAAPPCDCPYTDSEGRPRDWTAGPAATRATRIHRTSGPT